MDYPILIVPLSEEDGGGFLGHVPDLKGCISDGDTQLEALNNTIEAINDWLEECDRLNRERPEPGNAERAARAEKKTLVDAIHILSNRQDDIDGKIEEIDEKVENIQSWIRFSNVTTVSVIEEQNSDIKPC